MCNPTSNPLSTYSPQKLLDLWKRSALSGEQAIGHVLQNLVALAQRVRELDARLRHLEQSMKRDE